MTAHRPIHNYCEVNRPADRLRDMLKHEPWRAYDMKQEEKKAGTWKQY